MSDFSVPNRGPGRRLRATKPATISIGTDELVRGDVLAAEHGVSERTMKRSGGPYIILGGVVYRPRREYGEFIAAKIVSRNQPSSRPRPGMRKMRRGSAA